MKCVILQPSYIPWRGYFHQIEKADIFVFYDDVQYDKHGWRNRNKIKTPNGPAWLTIPVRSQGNIANQTLINQIAIDWTQDWTKKHWRSLEQSYGKAPYFERYAPLLRTYLSQKPEKLCNWTIDLTVALAHELGLASRKILRSSELGIEGSGTDRLVAILQRLAATHYISGPSAKAYLEEDKLHAAGITLEYMEYRYPEYPQLKPPFEPQVSIVDLLFMAGPAAPQYIWAINNPPSSG